MLRGFILAACMAMVGPAFAADIEVKMLNKGEGGTMVFEPMLVKANVGDTIRFLPTDKTHNVESIKGMLPPGVETFKSAIDQTFELKVTTPGLYGIQCTPHVSMGMVGLIQVGGDTSNMAAIKDGKLHKKSRERMDAALSQL